MTSIHKSFQVGDEVKIIEGRFQGYEGKIQSYDPVADEYLVVYGDERRSHAGHYRPEELSKLQAESAPALGMGCCQSCQFYRPLQYLEQLYFADHPRDGQCTHPHMTDLQGQPFWVRDEKNFGCLLHQPDL
ncbi:KOW motif-containing protein [Deinococcus roseus]|uniref:KOW domain-containing protein n=1 Tax=Deinococcus roseus TaxID=392414 RepID=A0ABQ2CWN5_9DEIO|nr:KOW motif-containing protein [Deinococcus roseus]GGJ28426.1 hypothetical protein GCM10008938_13120 [Deinococcus roseus]